MANLFDSKSLQLLTDLIREKIDASTDNWKKPWFTVSQGFPINVASKHNYIGFNVFSLSLQAEKCGYPLNGWASFEQYRKLNAQVNKGEKGTHVYYWKWDYVMKDDPQQSISSKEYANLPSDEQALYKKRFIFKEHCVFNVNQTNLAEANPKRYNEIKERFKQPELKDENGMYKHEGFDKMIENQSFICPVYVKQSNRAFYRPGTHDITIPLKGQYQDGKHFYGTASHECIHATGKQLSREMKGFFGSPDYAKEELVAEIGAALTGMKLGFQTAIEEHNAQYLKSWEAEISGKNKKDKSFLYNVVKEAVAACNLVVDCVLKEELTLQQNQAVAAQPEVDTTKQVAGELDFRDDDKPVVVLKPDTDRKPVGEVKDPFKLTKGEVYLYTVDNRVVKFNGVQGGIYNFHYADSGYKFQLAGGNKPLKCIKSFASELELALALGGKNRVEERENKFLFQKSEIPKDELKLAGIKLSDLTASDLKRLLQGKETKSVFNLKSPDGNSYVGTFSLHRNVDNTVEARLLPTDVLHVSKGIKM
jgi:antirestriction protein ArdC